ncbi:hypothetical protein FRX31_034337 [Thalictrum thalictroides]|uniref:Uncharacterized protein n=1 Tax=Thalictrum thalictroides TaxID=46969 RepID=A0A7J6UV54_THATH|nr:hypothetical protein FRX31_034337 [Thalictrum thalictroides]
MINPHPPLHDTYLSKYIVWIKICPNYFHLLLLYPSKQPYHLISMDELSKELTENLTIHRKRAIPQSDLRQSEAI